MISGSLDVTPAVGVATDRLAVFDALAAGEVYQVWLDGARHVDFVEAGIVEKGELFWPWTAQAVLAFCERRETCSGAAWLWLRAQTVDRLSGGVHRLDWRYGREGKAGG